ncbi:MAG: hypothetical protein JSR36_14210 [Proteobacteria bacterium]|nr:hypothetical protein [Pseudomonadota bacterium]
MKLRIKGASLRLRLTQAEVRALAAEGQVEEQVPFAGNARFTYRLSRDAGVASLEARFSGGVLAVRIPEAQARHWCTSEDVTLSASEAVGADTLRITVEKDFACLAPRSDEDESDNFPHPQAGAKTC